LKQQCGKVNKFFSKKQLKRGEMIALSEKKMNLKNPFSGKHKIHVR